MFICLNVLILLCTLYSAVRLLVLLNKGNTYLLTYLLTNFLPNGVLYHILHCIVSKDLYSAFLRITIQKRSQHENPGLTETPLRTRDKEEKLFISLALNEGEGHSKWRDQPQQMQMCLHSVNCAAA